MMKEKDVSIFRAQLLQDIAFDIRYDIMGGIREEKFLSLALEYLEEVGETEGAVQCREIKETSSGHRIHKINAYAVSESHETIDFFIVIFNGSPEIVRIYSDELKTAINLSTRFLQCILSDRIEGKEETSPVFDFIKTFSEIKHNVVRVNIFVLSDALIPITAPGQIKIEGLVVNYHIRDIEYFYRIHTLGLGKQAIVIDFANTFNHVIPYLSAEEQNDTYDTFIFVLPGHILAEIYRDHGSNLLEQNVRTFLQFRGKINKGIKETILNKPHMFLAYNNGISATAESVDLTDDKKSIASIKDFQIVNGGQTTASIFHTMKRLKSAEIRAVFVQVKLTVIKDPFEKPGIVSLVSRYANTQNKVSEADLSCNNVFHIKFEYFSRKIWTPIYMSKNQTRWFYERARGQYYDELLQIESIAQQKKWLTRNPKEQKFGKEDLAKFFLTWSMEPWWVVRGRQRNFIEFMKLADTLDVNSILYEDTIAKAIIFRTAERLYGTGNKAIGDLRYMVVPYSISWIRFATEDHINLAKIWENQKLSQDFEDFLLEVLIKVETFMRETAPGGLIGEWAKKTECWKLLQARPLNILIPKKELLDEKHWQKRYPER